MATTYTLISSVTVGSGGAANIEFTSIPATYTDLSLLFTARVTGNYEIYFTLNNSTSNFSVRRLQGAGTDGVSSSTSSPRFAGFSVDGDWTASTFSNNSVYIPNYAGSNNKSYSIDTVQERNDGYCFMNLAAGLWSDSSAITSIKLTPNTNSFLQHSTAYLYGISNA
jgi:hypothetical protein